MCRKCKIGKLMARSRKKSVTLTTEDVLFAVAGGAIGLAVNPLANKALAKQSENVRDMAGKALPALKVAGGGYLAAKKKMDRRLRFVGLGLAAEGGVELALKYVPAKYVSINGVDGNVYSYVGTTVEIPVNPTASASLPAGDPGFIQEAILGTADIHEQMAVL